MKRRSLGKQKGGMSPYQRYGKKPYKYSIGYYAWKRDNMGGANQQRMGKN